MDKSTTIGAKRLSFSEIEPKHQLAWDSTSLSALMRCPRYYQYTIVDGYVGRGESVHLKFGSDYNNSLVTFHQHRAMGDDYDTATLAAVRYALCATWDEILGRPWASDHPAKNRESLIRSVIWYLDRFRDDPMTTVILPDGSAAVEMSFRLHLDITSAVTGEDYLLCGYLDRLVDFNGSRWITDWKTSAYQLDQRYFRGYSPNNQMSQYDFAGTMIMPEPISGIVIDAVQLGATFSRFQRGTAPRTPALREEWLQDAISYIRQNEQYVLQDYWPTNSTSCTAYGGCVFQEICATSPELRQIKLNALFGRRMWDPLVVREI